MLSVHRTCLIVAVLLVSLAMIGPARAERRMALVIGNNDYAVGPLSNPVNDAGLMAEVLQETGFEVFHHTDLGYRALQRAVVDFSRKLRDAGDDTVGMVFYAGHAVQADGENYLIPVDAIIEDSLDLQIQTLEASTLMRSLEQAGNRLNIVVLDACRNNPFTSMSRSAARGLAKIEAPYGTLLAFSTAPGDVASDGTGANSPYTAALAKAMREPGVPVEQVFKQVRIAVMERTGNGQVPWESSSLTGDFYFVPPPGSTVEATTATQTSDGDREIEFWKSVAISEDPVLFQSYLDAYPNGTFRVIAEQRIAALAAAAESDARNSAAEAQWNAVKDSTDIALLSAMTEQYPDSVYAHLARLKIQSLQTASPPPVLSNPLDGTWELSWEAESSHHYVRTFCRVGEHGTATVSVSNGRFSGVLKTNFGNSGDISGVESTNGGFTITAKGQSWTDVDAVRGVIDGTLPELGGSIRESQFRCVGDVTMRKIGD